MSFTENLFLKRKMQELMEENSRLRYLIEMDTSASADTPLVTDVTPQQGPSSTRGFPAPTDTIQPYGRDRRGEDDAQGFPLEWLNDFSILEQFLREQGYSEEWIQEYMQDIIERARQLFNDGVLFPFWRVIHPWPFGNQSGGGWDYPTL
jgi:hypothetical protein